MNETKIRINEFKRMLPKLRERVIAVALLLAISASMLTTVTFAWITLSTNPEVTSVSTSIAANGNLEIALASGSESPLPSQVGDGALEDLARNLTWGNLINLSSSEYGLDNIVLRPALLNKSDLIERPLHGPVYNATGHVTGMNTNFGYAKWESAFERFLSTTDPVFEGNEYGVRAITSMKLGDPGDNINVTTYNDLLFGIESSNSAVQTKYADMANVPEYQDVLESLMLGYMIENHFKLNASLSSYVGDGSLKKSDVVQCIEMYKVLVECFEDEADVLAELLNLQAELNGVLAPDSGNETSGEDNLTITITGGEILALTPNTAKSELLDMGFTAAPDGFVANIETFLTDYNTLKDDTVRLAELVKFFTDNNYTTIKWQNSKKMDDGITLLIDDIIDNLVDVLNCTIATDDGTQSYVISSIGGTYALALNRKYCMTTISNKILYNFHSFCGMGITTSDYLTLSVSIGTIYSKVRTVSNKNYFDVERQAIADLITEKYGKPPLVAKDTYGFAIDFWVRTNAASTFLTLQGNVLTETEDVPVVGKDANGNDVDIYTITVQLESEEGGGGDDALSDLIGVSKSYDVYKIVTEDDSGEETTEVTTWYFADNHSLVTPEALGLEEGATFTPIRKIETVEYVIGYEGDNRIWNGDEHVSLSVNSSTQGSGSCYVFYAESPVDQERSLEILKSMKVAFINEDGELLATAFMDSDRHYAESGKVIVPLVLDNESISIGTDINGDSMYAITALEQNVATRITAIVYLDGRYLSNEHVLASADIEGKINIQFGSSAALYPLGNEELYNAELVASVNEISPTSFDYDTLGDDERMITTVKVAVMGDQPGTMTANFIRRINATQGSPEGTFTLTDEDGDGVWEGSYEFLYPGEYILRSVYMDGVERDLQLSTPGAYPTVTVNGFTISSVSTLSRDYVMTDASSHNERITIKFASNDPDKMPRSVVGKFIGDGTTVNVNFAYDPTSTSWVGNANFVSSGAYKMQFLALDGQYDELPENFWREIELILGMRVNITTDSPTEMAYGQENTPETLELKVEILDNNGDIIRNLAGTDLYYAMGGTTQLHTKLTWDSVEEYYYGELPVQSGTWNFNRVVVRRGENVNTLTRANADAPVFTVIPPDPPVYIDGSGVAVQYFADDRDGQVFVRFKDATSATVVGKFVNKDKPENIVYVTSPEFAGEGEATSEDYRQLFSLAVPDDGVWVLEGVSLYNVFDSDSNLHSLPEDGTVDTADEFETGIIFNADTVDNYVAVEVVVLHRSSIEVTYDFKNASALVDETNKTVALGKDASGNTVSTFMQTVYVNEGGITIEFSDGNLNLIKRGYFSIEDVKLAYKYEDVDKEYGGYTGDYLDAQIGTQIGTFTFTKDAADSTSFVLGNNTDVPFQHAAKYVVDSLAFTVKTADSSTELDKVLVQSTDSDTSKVNKYLGGAYAIEVWSIKPYAKFTATSPAEGQTFNVAHKKDNPQEADVVELANDISDDGYSVTCYYTAKSDGCDCNGYDAPLATVTLFDISNFTSAQLVINSNGTASDVVYTFSNGNLSNSQAFGQNGDNRVYLGTNAQATDLTVVYGGYTYTFNLTNPLKATLEY